MSVYLVNEINFTKLEHFSKSEITKMFLYLYINTWIISGIYLLISIYKKFLAKKIAKKINFSNLKKMKKENDLGIVSDDEYQKVLKEYKSKYL